MNELLDSEEINTSTANTDYNKNEGYISNNNINNSNEIDFLNENKNEIYLNNLLNDYENNLNDNLSNDSNDENILINKENFKMYLGIISKFSNNFLIERLYNILLKLNFNNNIIINNNRKYINNQDILNYYNILNNEEKNLEIAYLFFDINNKGYVTKNDFISVMNNIYLYSNKIFKRNINLKISQNFENFFDFLIGLNNKNNNVTTWISKNTFIEYLNKDLIDYFYLFNNNKIQNFNYNISSQNFSEMKKLLYSFQNLQKNLTTKDLIESDITLITENFLEEINKDNNNENKNNFQNLNSNLSTLKTIISDKSYFSFTTTFPNNDFINTRNSFNIMNKNVGDKEIDELSINSNQSEFSNFFSNKSYFLEDEINDNVYEMDNKAIKTIKKIKENKKKIKNNFNLNENLIEKNRNNKFFFLKPFSKIKNNELEKEIKKNNIDLQNTLILVNKNNYKTYLNNLESSINDIINNVDRNNDFKLYNFNYKYVYLNKPLKIKENYNFNKKKKIFEIENENILNSNGLKFYINILYGINKCFQHNENINSDYVINEDILDEKYTYTYHSILDNIKMEITEYYPKLFYNIRHLKKINNKEFLNSLNIENFLINLLLGNITNLNKLFIINSNDNSEFILFSSNSKYIIKSVKNIKSFDKFLINYYYYLNEDNKTFLEIYLGFYSIFIPSLNKIYNFVIKKNIFYSKYNINKIYDIKGSSTKKRYSKYKNILLKDNDFMDNIYKFKLNNDTSETILNIIKSDTNFLFTNNITNYSLFIGIGEDIIVKKDEENIFEENCFLNKEKNELFAFGFKDIYREYGSSNKFKYFFKNMVQNNKQSLQPPLLYRQRLIRFAENFIK